MAATIKEEVGVETELIRGGNGVFDVVVDGRTIYSKSETGRFPEPGEIVPELKG